VGSVLVSELGPRCRLDRPVEAQSLEQKRKSIGRHWLAPDREKHGILFSRRCTSTGFREVGTVFGQVFVKRLETIARHRHLLPLVPLAMDDQQAQFAIYITQPQTDNLTTP